MNTIAIAHYPVWRLIDGDWYMLVGNQCVAKLIHVEYSEHCPNVKWVSLIEGHDYPDYGWHAADFVDLESAHFDIAQWWLWMCRGIAYNPRTTPEFL